ncbi:MAG: Stp1/IreP family PP2C-type Ser/Thr phosphatase [Myxococcota bacterium]
MTEPALRVAARTDVGLVRAANEDACEVFEAADGSRLLVVADGMGGHRGGATASGTAVETIGRVFSERGSGSPGELLSRAITTANARIFELARSEPELSGMGTTVVALLLDARGRGTVAHVGDSRAYRYRRGRLEPLTIDHSYVADLHRRGVISAEEAAHHPRRNEILRSVGVGPEVEVDVAGVEVAPGDRFVLCSDGLSGVVDDDEIAAIVQAESPAQAVDSLVELANERGGPDNITVQILAIPVDATQVDPEATAPVEISEVGIQAIETRRRTRARLRRAGLLAALALGLIGVFVVWRILAGGQDAGRGPDAPVDEPRRGIPREAP